MHDGTSKKRETLRAYATPTSDPDHDVVIVGAGFGGMGVAIQLRRLGIDSFVVLDRAREVGGAWQQNTYPGVSVDVPFSVYCFSFAPSIDWSRKFARGAELRTYAQHIAATYDLRRHMRFGTNVVQVVYDERGQRWNVHVAGQATITARVLVLATGLHGRPKRPDIAGLDGFRGKIIHAGAWDHDYELVGKRGAVIGTGPTAAQLIPEVAKDLVQLTVYQRSASWVVPKPDALVSRARRALYARLPFLQRIARFIRASLLDLTAVAAVIEHRRLPWLNKLAERICLAHLGRSVADPALRRMLTPDYPFGCKRPAFSNTYYRALARFNVDLITEPIERIEPDGIVTRYGGKRAFDVLLLATGFEISDGGASCSILGRHGVDLRERWQRARFESYEGVTIAGFPNLFHLAAPYSYTGLSYFFTLECQMQHIARCLRELRRRGKRSFEVRPEAQARYVASMQARGSLLRRADRSGARNYAVAQIDRPNLMRHMSTVECYLRHRLFPLRDYRFE